MQIHTVLIESVERLSTWELDTALLVNCPGETRAAKHVNDSTGKEDSSHVSEKNPTLYKSDQTLFTERKDTTFMKLLTCPDTHGLRCPDAATQRSLDKASRFATEEKLLNTSPTKPHLLSTVKNVVRRERKAEK